MKKIILKILKENYQNNKLYQSLKKRVLDNKLDYLYFNAQLFLGDYHGGSNKSVEECLEDNYCYCRFLKSEKKWAELMLSDYNSKLGEMESTFDVEGVFPYQLTDYGLTGLESMEFYDKLLMEMLEENNC
jgi:hypothetical protein